MLVGSPEGGGFVEALSLRVAGTVVEPYFQQYQTVRGPGEAAGELLSRPTGSAQVEEFFNQLTHQEHVEILTWQLRLKEWFTERTGWRMSINVDNKLINTTDRRVQFLELVAEYPTAATFEFTETNPMPPVFEANRLLREMRELGHRSALDDFGTGLNGMSLLTDYDFDVVKVDRSLIFDIESRVEKRKTIRLIRQMLGVLGKRHVVEGVENEDLKAMLVAAGFTTFQGYVVHRPEPLEGKRQSA
jgi:EAL domain-containing protein (putative c-di-GMP-specific phosphodiesterase class I)